jgi:hypothetical protein
MRLQQLRARNESVTKKVSSSMLVSSSSFGCGVVMLHSRKDRLTANSGIITVALLDCFGLVRKFRVLDAFPEPTRIVAFAQVEQPSFVVNPFCHAVEDVQIVSSQLQLPLWTSEIETLIRSESTIIIFAQVAATFRFGFAELYYG